MTAIDSRSQDLCRVRPPSKRPNFRNCCERRAAEGIEPSRFSDPLMAAWLEHRRCPSGLWRLWKSAGALVSSLALTTAALAVLSFTITEPAPAPAETTVTAESVALFDAETEERLTEAEMLSAMYVDDEGTR